MVEWGDGVGAAEAVGRGGEGKVAFVIGTAVAEQSGGVFEAQVVLVEERGGAADGDESAHRSVGLFPEVRAPEPNEPEDDGGAEGGGVPAAVDEFEEGGAAQPGGEQAGGEGEGNAGEPELEEPGEQDDIGEGPGGGDPEPGVAAA